ncbi:hypothetical protein AB1N83_013737 [Pleurotus pulmonarius]
MRTWAFEKRGVEVSAFPYTVLEFSVTDELPQFWPQATRRHGALWLRMGGRLFEFLYGVAARRLWHQNESPDSGGVEGRSGAPNLGCYVAAVEPAP